MSLALKIVPVIIVLMVVAIAALRIRKLRRDEIRALSRPVERRLMSPPPSPYAPSKGFRLLDGPLDATRRPEPPRPRLEADRDYVFSETQMPVGVDVVSTQLRHNQEWALSRSARRPATYTGLRVAVIVVALVLVVGAVGYYLQRGTPKAPTATTTTTTTTTTHPRATTTTATASPSSFTSTSRSAETASYRVPATKYEVVVNGTRGPSWAVYKMGPQRTLEWQGLVAQGSSESLPMTGNSTFMLGSPNNATVSVGESPVVLPTPLPTTLTLSFVSSSTTSG